MRCTASAPHWGWMRNRFACWNAIIWISCAPGAKLKGDGRDRLAAIAQRLAMLGTQFSQNVLADEEDWVLPLTEAQMAGVPASRARRGRRQGQGALGCTRPSPSPCRAPASNPSCNSPTTAPCASSSIAPGSRAATMTMPTTTTRSSPKCWHCAPSAPRLLGYENFAAFKLADTMAGTPAKARALLEEVWAPARQRALEERDALQALIARRRRQFPPGALGLALLRRKAAPGAIRFRRRSSCKPYFQLSNLIEAAFFTAGKLFGLSFQRTPRHSGLSSRCAGLGGQRAKAHVIGLFYGDYFARPGKQGGAWMSSFRDQQRLDGEVLPHHHQQLQFQQKPSPACCPSTMP